MGSERSGSLTWRCLRLVAVCGVAVVGVACSTDNPLSGAGGAASAGAAGTPDSGLSGGGSGGGSSSGGGGLPSEAGAGGRGGATSFCAQGAAVEGAEVPPGFCVRNFATVAAVRTLVFAPNGDLFVAAPSTATPGGSANGPGQIIVITDDDGDGVGESHVFVTGVPDVHGLALGGGYLYFTTATTVYRTPYTLGQRAAVAVPEDLGLPMSFGSGRWTHGLARSVGGSLLASSGEYSSCGVAPTGSISQLTMGGSAIVAAGFRNPMYMRCHYKDELCAANELGEDQVTGAREKFVVIRPDTNYGYPCCFGSKEPVSSGSASACTTVAPEDATFTLGDTPFGFDWEHEAWPAPYNGAIFVALHGTAYSSPPWAGAKIVYASTDPSTHLPAKDAWQPFVGGFGPNGGPLQRPADIAFSPDGRLFFADDTGGQVYWVARETPTPAP